MMLSLIGNNVRFADANIAANIAIQSEATAVVYRHIQHTSSIVDYLWCFRRRMTPLSNRWLLLS